jgi:hypothetical protein
MFKQEYGLVDNSLSNLEDILGRFWNSLAVEQKIIML